LRNDFTDRFNIIFPDRVDQIASLNQTLPAACPITSRQRELSISEFGRARDRSQTKLRWARMKLIEVRDCGWVAATKCAKQILGLVL